MKNIVVLDLETTGLSKLENRITCIGCKTKDEEISFMDLDEKKMLHEFWGWIAGIEFPLIVGFNVHFDLKFLHVRSMKHDIQVPLCLKDKSLDLRFELLFYESKAKGTLDDYAKFIGLDGKISNGAKAVILFDEKRFDELKKYCMSDVQLTWKLFERCKKARIFTNVSLYT